MDIFRIDWELDFLKDEERKAYYEAFSAFDWNNNGKISTGALIFAMRRAGRAESGVLSLILLARSQPHGV